MEVFMTAALGKRSKYQREEIAQLYLYAHSSLTTISHPIDTTNNQGISIEEVPADGSEAVTFQENEMKEPESQQYEIGRRMVKEAAGGEEAAVREVKLDDVDTGMPENIIIEGGPQFKDKEELNKGGVLHPIDQAIILALCLDVSNSNPTDGLTNAEMLPYIERVLDQSKNWMVHSTGLLERSWLEFERRKTMDRAMLQIQALIDQHSTKLTYTQSTYKSIEESAPVQQRVQYIYSLVYPSQFELKRDLANRYLRCQVFMSALNYFKELEMWDEVVTCYQLLQKPHRAEIVVREQLRLGESPYMLTALADITGQEDLYERAWTLSQHRYARAKRTLAKIHYDRGDYSKCIDHMTQALQVQPMVATAWYLKGIACMRTERWEEGVQAFLRCVQQDEEIGEAWANIGAIYMRQQSWHKAYQALTEAYKIKREDWKVLENMLHVTLNMQRWKECIRVMTSLVDLRHKSDRPVHYPQLRYLMKAVVAECMIMLGKTEDTDRSSIKSEDKDKVQELPDLAKHFQTLLQKISNSTKSDGHLWDITAEFYDSFGHYANALDARLKQVSKIQEYMKSCMMILLFVYVVSRLYYRISMGKERGCVKDY
jgi:tetratricopeptide (TPR) repeat protein